MDKIFYYFNLNPLNLICFVNDNYGINISMKLSQIRPLVICIFLKDEKILINKFHDPITEQIGCRPLGGGIEFGETSRQALIREIQEEINVEIKNIQYLATLENIFSYAGRPCHEIVQIYNAEFVDAILYEQEFIVGHESDGAVFNATWIDLKKFDSTLPLYPLGLLELLTSTISREIT